MKLSVVATAGLALLLSGTAAVAQTYDFTFTGNNGMDATGTFDIVGGVVQSDSSISVINVPLEAGSPPYTTASGNFLTAGGDVRDFDGDVITYDTVVNPLSNPIFDSTGVTFASSIINGNISSAPAASDGGTPVYDTLINIWGNGPGSYTMFVGEANPADLNPDGTLIAGRDAQWVYVYGESGTMNITPVPEPATAGCLLLGLGVFALTRRFKR